MTIIRSPVAWNHSIVFKKKRGIYDIIFKEDEGEVSTNTILLELSLLELSL